jgi:hypothetical protein
MKNFVRLLVFSIALSVAYSEASEVYSETTGSAPHFYLKLQPMTSSKAQCKRSAKKAMKKSGFADIISGKHGVWGVKEGYKAQIKCSKAEKAIAFVVVGQEGGTVMTFIEELQKNFGAGFPVTRDP